MVLTKEEVNRKLLHILSGTMIPAGIFYLPLVPGVPRWGPAVILAVLTVFSLGIEYLRLKSPAVQKIFYSFAGTMLRSEERTSLTGSTWIFASAFLCSILFAAHPYISFMVLSMFILGDAAAALVGISVGRIKIGKKSLEGSLACFVLSMVLLLVVFPRVPLLLDVWNGKMFLIVAVAGALSTTVFELFPVRISRKIVLNDNLTVPLFTGIIMLTVHKIAVGAGGY